MTDRIIVPLDGSELAESCLPVARGMAQQSGCRVALISVVELSREFMRWAGNSKVTESGPVADEIKEREAYLDRIGNTFADTRVDTFVHPGKPVDQILEMIGVNPNQIIVMATHGKSGWRRTISGSVTTRIIHDTHVPIIVVKGNASGNSNDSVTEVNRILVPLDSSFLSESVLKVLQHSVGLQKPAYHVLQVVESALELGDGIGVSLDYDAYMQYSQAMNADASEYIRGVAKDLSKKNPNVTWEVRDGEPDRVIHDVAKEWGANLIAMATHGRSGLSRYFLGSTSEKVLRDTELPVMLVRPSEDEAKSTS